MIVKAIHSGVSEERIAKVLSLVATRQKRHLLTAFATRLLKQSALN